MPFTRRRLLVRMAATTPLLAGCLGGGGGGDGDGETPTRTPTPTPTASPTDTPTATPTPTPTPTPTATPPQEADAVVEAVDVSFDPRKISVDIGDTVAWINRDSTTHTVTSTWFHDVATQWQFNAQFAGGEAVTHTFSKKGIYEYYCTVHGRDTMCGAILVGGTTLDKDLPCAGGGGGYY